jgi:dipeptidyl aminopeptidase/acylaminoacyl peptidase
VATVGTNHQEVVASDIRLDYDGSEFSWSPDGALLSYHTNGQWESKQGAEEERIDDCYIVSAAGGPARNVSHFSATDYVLHESEQSVPLWDRVGTYIYFVHNGTLWRSSVKEGEANKVSRLPNRQIKTLIPQYNNLLLWTVDGGRATVVVVYDDVKKQEGFYKIDLATGTDVKLLERGECYAACLGSGLGLPFVAMKDAQHLVYLAEDAKHCSDLWFSDAGFESPRQLTHLNPQFDKYELGAVRLIDWLSDDGERLRGALLLPSTFREGNRYPLVVWVYGGGLMSNYANHFGLQPVVNLQLLATRGYAVLLPDSPQHEEGRAMFELAKTVLSGINKAIDMGIADPERLGVMGQSNGGYSTLALVIQTKRFKAAIEMDGFAEILGLYTEMSKNGQAFGTGLFERDLDIMGGTPWQFRERYIENSPIFYFDRIETPLLIVHGSEDHVVDPFLGDQVFVALRRLGKEVEYAKYEGEGHVPTSYANRVDLCNRVLAWFEKHLKEKK